MKKSRFSEHQIIKILKEVETRGQRSLPSEEFREKHIGCSPLRTTNLQSGIRSEVMSL